MFQTGDRVSWRLPFEARRFGVVIASDGDIYTVRENGHMRSRDLHVGVLTKEE